MVFLLASPLSSVGVYLQPTDTQPVLLPSSLLLTTRQPCCRQPCQRNTAAHQLPAALPTVSILRSGFTHLGMRVGSISRGGRMDSGCIILPQRQGFFSTQCGVTSACTSCRTRESPMGSVSGDLGGFFLAGRHPLLPVPPPILTVGRPVPAATLSESTRQETGRKCLCL